MRLLGLSLVVLLLPSAAALGLGERVGVAVEDHAVWLLDALTMPLRVPAVGWSPIDDLHLVTVGVVGWGSTTEPASGGSHRAEHVLDPRAPGAYLAFAEARTSGGDAARDMGRLDVEVVPFHPESVEGFPPLGDVEDPLTGVSYFIELVVRPDGSVGYHRVAIGGRTLLDNFDVAPFPQPEDRFVTISFDRGVSEAILEVDGDVAWRGLVRQTGGEWWHVVPFAHAGRIGSAHELLFGSPQ